MFTKEDIDTLFAQLRKEYGRSPDWELLNRQAHLAIASLDSGRSIEDIDSRVVALIQRQQPPN